MGQGKGNIRDLRRCVTLPQRSLSTKASGSLSRRPEGKAGVQSDVESVLNFEVGDRVEDGTVDY